MSKASILAEINAMEGKLDETLTAVDRGPVKDALRLVIPMMKDQNTIMRQLLEECTS